MNDIKLSDSTTDQLAHALNVLRSPGYNLPDLLANADMQTDPGCRRGSLIALAAAALLEADSLTARAEADQAALLDRMSRRG